MLDGSEAEKSGNGIRIFARYLMDCLLSTDDNNEYCIRTISGVTRCLVPHAYDVSTDVVITIDIGVPVILSQSTYIDVASRHAVLVSVGNPHCVIEYDHLDDISEQRTRTLGPLIERHSMFPNRTNVQFVYVVDRHNVVIYIWERGSGYTLSSGSSSSAVVAAMQYVNKVDDDVTVTCPGGLLYLHRDGVGHLWLTGAVSSSTHVSIEI